MVAGIVRGVDIQFDPDSPVTDLGTCRLSRGVDKCLSMFVDSGSQLISECLV